MSEECVRGNSSAFLLTTFSKLDPRALSLWKDVFSYTDLGVAEFE